MWPRFDRHAGFQSAVVKEVSISSLRRNQFKLGHTLAVQQKLHLVFSVEPFDVFVAVTGEVDLHFVHTRSWEGMVQQHAAPRSQRQTNHVFLLRHVGRHSVRVTFQLIRWSGDRQLADLSSRIDVA